MPNLPWEILFAVLGVLVPVAAAMYEFVFVGRKRLGYRVQMDTTATDEVHSEYAGALQQLRQGQNGEPLVSPSFVLLRIENNGATHIDPSDYAVLDDDKVGIRVRFPGRRVAGMVVTELSDDFLRPAFAEGLGLSTTYDVIELPKVPLNHSAHYKVLATLERVPEDANGHRERTEDPKVIGGIKGGVGRGGIQETKSRTGASWRTIALVCFLVAVVLAQVTVSLTDDTAPLDCAKGKLTLVGSTAFQPALREAADSYAKTCPEAGFAFETRGSTDGLRRLEQDAKGSSHGKPDLLAFSDGAKDDGYPQLLPRPIAFSPFTLVINKEAGVQDLSLDQVRQLYAGNMTNWSELDGNNQPIRLLSRNPDSGTRLAFQKRVLGGNREPGTNSDDCEKVDPGAPPGVIRCERASTRDVLNAVANTPGALGYSEVGAAAGRQDLLLVRIDGQKATLEGADHGAYPFWETEYAYTYGEPRANSLVASFLRYLTNEVGKDIVRSHGHRPCAELEKPVLCRPS